MQFLLGCLGIILLLVIVILIVQWIFGNIVAVIGIALAAWGIYEWYKNRNLNVKSKVPSILVILGLMLTFGWFILKPEAVPEVAEEEIQETNGTVDMATDSGNETSEEPVNDEKENTKLIAGTVTSVTDGDTIKVDMDGKEETIRLILVDTPETKHPQLGKQPLGEEASAFTTERLSGKEIEIEPGVEERDQYGRLLAYVYMDDKMFNKTLVEEGYARVAVYPPNTEHLEELETAQATAKEKGIGIWEIENYTKEDGYDATAYEPEPEPESVVAPEPEPVVEEEQEPVVVEEPEPQQESVYYDNCSDARAAGAAPVYQGEPGYGSHLDRDGDGIGCDK
ncbi:hypothetical protein AWH48_11315 [Domibacillus aminovorans]|uniref:TNase-like domain-containing protein n=1 Tax=Domibacillus aminovorans TaxID=29332 RepID=A0A177KKG3_9BACI|nr:thermonuclease family protein [Domibacillus aminovorans]OAH53853.1 hypothetical protein AWH48_11315 [Domibacillus aminovorans]